MSETETLESIQFDAEDVSYIEAGEAFRSGTHPYDSAVVGTVHLFLNGEELVAGNRFPAPFELSFTVRELYRMLTTVTTEGFARNQPFCCSCGVYGCTGISWEMELTDGGLILGMDDSIGNAFPSHSYRTELEALRGAHSELTEILIATLQEADADGTTAGTVREFQEWKRGT